MKRLLAAAMLMALVGTGAGGGDAAPPDTEAPMPTPAESRSAVTEPTEPLLTTTPESVPVPTPSPSTPPSPSGTLRIGFATGVQTFDPALAGTSQISYLRPVFDTLFAIDADGNVAGRLVEDYDLSADSLILQLREGVLFSDGAPLDAVAVAANLERTRAAGGTAAAAFVPVAAVSASGPMEVTVSLTRPAPTLPDDLAGLAGMIMSPSALASPDIATTPVGSGPWVVESVAPGDRVVYTLSPGHWDPAAQGVERIEILEMPDNNARTNALLSGQVDMAQLVASQLAATRQAGFDVMSFPDVYYGLLVLDRAGTIVPALADPRVREALHYAVDREAIIEHVFFGAGTASPQPYPEGRDGYVDDLGADYSYDADRARQLLADAGYADGFSLTIPAIAPTQPFAEAVAGYLGDIGITVQIDVLQPGTLAAAAQSGDYPVFVGPGAVADPLRWYAVYFMESSVWNPFGVPVPGVDDAAAQLGVADGDGRAEPAASLVGAIIADGALATVGLADLLTGVRDGVDVPGWEYDAFPDVRGIRLGP